MNNTSDAAATSRGVGGALRSLRHKCIRARSRAVPHGDLVTGLQQIRRHRAAHQSQSNKSNRRFHRGFLLSADPTCIETTKEKVYRSSFENRVEIRMYQRGSDAEMSGVRRGDSSTARLRVRARTRWRLRAGALTEADGLGISGHSVQVDDAEIGNFPAEGLYAALAAGSFLRGRWIFRSRRPDCRLRVGRCPPRGRSLESCVLISSEYRAMDESMATASRDRAIVRLGESD